MLPGWMGLVLTVIFGGLNVFQFVRGLLRKRMWSYQKAQLEQIRVMCTEAIQNGEAINTDAARQFVRGIMHQIRGIERGLGFDQKDVGTRRS